MIQAAKGFNTDYYRIIHTRDITGVEISADFKNVFATGMGIIEGLYDPEMAGNFHNFSSLVFNQSVLEIAKIAERVKRGLVDWRKIESRMSACTGFWMRGRRRLSLNRLEQVQK